MILKPNPTVVIIACLLSLLLACQKEASYPFKLSKSLVLPAAPINDPSYGASANPTGDVIGGGICYSKQVEGGDFLVHTAAEFLSALELAQAGQTILVANGAQIDLSGQIDLRIPAGVTLAGNRGQCFTQGALIFNNDMPFESVWFWVGQDVRITGLRFRGPDDAFANIDYNLRPAKSTICFVLGEENIEIDNCEISQFSRGGIEIYPGGKNIYIHHNFIHDVHAYPVIALNRSGLPILIEANLIYWVWHATAGSGYPGTGYEARYNIMVRQTAPTSWLPYTGHHGIDMHPYLQVLQERNHRIAGHSMKIHHNTFLSAAVNDPSESDSPDVFVRGTPQELAQFYNNKFFNTEPDKAVVHFSGNTWVYNNKYGPSEMLIPIAQETSPQILFHQPPPPDIDVPLLSGDQTPVNITINMLDGLQLNEVIINLNGNTIFQGNAPPLPNELNIHFCDLNNALPYQELTVTAIDNRGIAGRHTTVFKGNCSNGR
ncbi:MAG: right-handed parallel beta-helix repeat-containing protein [Saprospiraceae bacterium]